MVASLLQSTGFRAHGLQESQSTGLVVVAHGFSCSVACGIFSDQGSNPVPCTGRQIPIHCTTREVLIPVHFLENQIRAFSESCA